MLPDLRISAPDATQYDAALARQAQLTKPGGALGRLEELSAWLSAVAGACPPPAIRHPALVIFAGDHAVASRASAYPPEVTAQMVANFVTNGAAANVLARSRGAAIRVIDAGVDVDWPASGLPVPPEISGHRIRRGAVAIDREDAMTIAEASTAFALGVSVARDAVAAGADLLIAGDMGIGNTTPAAALVGLLTDTDAAHVIGRGTGIDDQTWARKAAAVRDAMRRSRPTLAALEAGDPVPLLAACTGPDLAATTGFLLASASARVPVLLDGVISCSCALLAARVDPAAGGWWQAGHRSTEPAAALALRHLRLEPLLDVGMRLGEGTGALLALPILTAAGDLLREMNTFEEAGVSRG
ncbi:MAG: nicotinate-nucleotide--dimethylbenzimidazole phosphoribosyltransferase [Candidatus Nanopelagicales bacterium]